MGAYITGGQACLPRNYKMKWIAGWVGLDLVGFGTSDQGSVAWSGPLDCRRVTFLPVWGWVYIGTSFRGRFWVFRAEVGTLARGTRVIRGGFGFVFGMVQGCERRTSLGHA